MGGCTPRGCAQFLERSQDLLRINKRTLYIELCIYIKLIYSKRTLPLSIPSIIPKQSFFKYINIIKS